MVKEFFNINYDPYWINFSTEYYTHGKPEKISVNKIKKLLKKWEINAYKKLKH